MLSRPRASPRTRHGELSAGFALARRQPCRRSLKVMSGASAAGAAGYGARNREIPRGTMSLPSATREERWTRNASSPGTEVPWLRRFPQNRNKRRLWNEVKPHLHPSPRCPSGRRCGESPLPSTGTRLRSLIFPACSWGFPDALKSEPHPCAAFAATTAERDGRTRTERRIFVIDSPSSQQTTACHASRCINSSLHS